MTIEFIWQLPTSGDGRYAAPGITRRGERAAGAPSPLQAGVSDPRGRPVRLQRHPDTPRYAGR